MVVLCCLGYLRVLSALWDSECVNAESECLVEFVVVLLLGEVRSSLFGMSMTGREWYYRY